MPLLIDGHNLIGRMPDMSLGDPDDELDLVKRVRRYCWRTRRRATIVFDKGLPGGVDLGLSGPPVEVVFASPGSSADRVIRERLSTARDPRGLLVVSSDRAVQKAAQAQGARVVLAEDFAGRLAGVQAGEETEKETPGAVGDVEEWLHLFEEMS